jgi:hypothetical protein
MVGPPLVKIDYQWNEGYSINFEPGENDFQKKKPTNLLKFDQHYVSMRGLTSVSERSHHGASENINSSLTRDYRLTGDKCVGDGDKCVGDGDTTVIEFEVFFLDGGYPGGQTMWKRCLRCLHY